LNNLDLLCSGRAILLDIDPLLLFDHRQNKPAQICFFGRLSEMKKAALEKYVPKCDIFFFFLKVHQAGGTMGAAI
jgi:hypothetical protein